MDKRSGLKTLGLSFLVAVGTLTAMAIMGLMVSGWTSGELGVRGTVVFVALGIAAWIGLPYLPQGSDFVTSAIAMLDIALVFLIFKGDVRIT